MKRLLFILSFLTFINAQVDTVGFKINMSNYEMYQLEKEKYVAFPVFNLNNRAKDYRCGDNFEYIINFKDDSISNNAFFTTKERPITTPLDGKLIPQYYMKNPNTFVFQIMGFKGYWAIKDGKLLKLEEKGFWIFKGINEINANVYVSSQCGEEYVRDCNVSGIRKDYNYTGCKQEFYEDDFKKVYIKIIDSKE